MILDDGPGWYNGTFFLYSGIDGKPFPNIPVLMVREGDLVKITYINTSQTESGTTTIQHLLAAGGRRPVAASVTRKEGLLRTAGIA
jgi:hypothetical protein